MSRPYAGGASPAAWTTYVYDALGRTTQFILPDGSVTSYTYQGNVTTVTSPTGKWKKYTADVLGNLVQVTEPAPEGGTHETYYTYNVLGQLVQVHMPRAEGTQYRTFTYDLATGRMTSATNPENGTVFYTYNGDGTLQTKTDAKGQRLLYTYDQFKRVTLKQVFPDPANPSQEDQIQRATFGYDTGTNGLGRLVRANNYWIQYTPGGLMKSYNNILPPLHTYDNEGRLVTTRYPDIHCATFPYLYGLAGLAFTYSYDTLGRPIRLTGSDGLDWVKDVQYDASGAITALSRIRTKACPGQPTSCTSTATYVNEVRSYNVLGQLTRKTVTDAGSGSVVADIEYRFPAAGANDGRITQRKDWVTSEEVTYGYDALNRLISAATTGPEWGLSFSYDGFGNLRSETPSKGTAPNAAFNYDAATNRLVGPYQYDANGNITGMPGLTLTYDAENRLIQAASPTNGTEQYRYDVFNRRIRKIRPDASSYDPVYGLYGERLGAYRENTGERWAVEENVYFAGELIWSGLTRPDYKGLFTGNSSIIVDRLGTVVAREGGSERPSFYPYGEERAPQTGQDRVKFGTYYRDSVTNLDYADQRYYSTQIGRFLTPDPYGGSAVVRVPQSWNRYSYVVGDPLNGYDPSGLCPISYVADKTGPQGGCTINSFAWSQGMEAWSVAPTSGLSQQTSIYHSNPAAWYEEVYKAAIQGYMKPWNETRLGWGIDADEAHHIISTLEYAIVQKVPPTSEWGPGTSYFWDFVLEEFVKRQLKAPNLGPGAEPITPGSQSATWGGPLPFAPNPNFRCPAGQHPTSNGGECIPNPTSPPPHPPVERIPPPQNPVPRIPTPGTRR